MSEMDSDDVGNGASREELAAKAFVRRQAGHWTALDQADLEAWLSDPACEQAYREVRKQWVAAGNHATAPAILKLREEAMVRARRNRTKRWPGMRLRNQGKWIAVAASFIALGMATTYMLNDFHESVFETGIGEQRVVELEDHSRIALDAKTRVVVRMTRDSRVMQLSEGQAEFMVASDPRRPFRVEAGAHTITAVGTSFNVEYLDRAMRIAMVEGKVAISVGKAAAGEGEGSSRFPVTSGTLDLVAGQELHVDPDGQVEVNLDADIEAAVMWRQGKIIFKDSTLDDAVRRINRYSRMQIAIEAPEIESLRISGIFDAGDTQSFIEAIQVFLPVTAAQEGPQLVTLRST